VKPYSGPSVVTSSSGIDQARGLTDVDASATPTRVPSGESAMSTAKVGTRMRGPSVASRSSRSSVIVASSTVLTVAEP
jgi:hypothetical protein